MRRDALSSIWHKCCSTTITCWEVFFPNSAEHPWIAADVLTFLRSPNSAPAQPHSPQSLVHTAWPIEGTGKCVWNCSLCFSSHSYKDSCQTPALSAFSKPSSEYCPKLLTKQTPISNPWDCLASLSPCIPYPWGASVQSCQVKCSLTTSERAPQSLGSRLVLYRAWGAESYLTPCGHYVKHH